MSINTAERQYPLVAIIDFTYSDFVSGTAKDVLGLPSDAIVIDGHIVITTAFNSATSDSINVGDTDSANRYANAVNAQSAALTALGPDGTKLGQGKKITMTWTGAGAAPTAGAGRLVVSYVRAGRANENQD